MCHFFVEGKGGEVRDDFFDFFVGEGAGLRGRGGGGGYWKGRMGGRFVGGGGFELGLLLLLVVWDGGVEWPDWEAMDVQS